MLNILKVYPFRDLAQGIFYGSFHVPIDEGTFLKGLLFTSEL